MKNLALYIVCCCCCCWK